MARKKVKGEVQREVLLQSRRRCCICFGLNRDIQIEPGQIAHLDRDNQNDKVENLAFLCLSHHDEYDSNSSQRKNFIVEEVKAYRKELVAALDQAFSAVHFFGDGDRSDTFAGQYIRIDDDSISSQLIVSKLLDGRYHVSGAAFRGPNMHHAIIEFVTTIEDGKIRYREPGIDDEEYYLDISFVRSIALVDDNDSNFSYGAWVKLKGTYEKSMPSTKVENWRIPDDT